MKTDASWLELPAQDYCESVRDGTHDSPKFHDSGYPLVTSKAIKNGELILDNAGFISESDFNEINRRSRVEQWDVLFTMIGTLGDVYLERSPEVKYAIKNIGLFKCGDELKAKWLYYWFRIPSTKAAILQLRRGASQQYLPLGTLRALRIRYPANNKIAESIIEVASQYDDLIENNKRRIALLEESARQLYKEWFVRFRFPGHEHVKIVDGVPEGWEKGLVSDLGEVITGKTPSTKVLENYGGDIPFIKTPDMHGNPIVIKTDQYLTERGGNTQSGKLIPPHSIMVSCIGTIGVTSLNAVASHTNQQINSVVPAKDHLRYFTYFGLASLKQRMEAMGGGATMANVNKTKFSSLPMILPTVVLLNQFHDCVAPIFCQIEKLTLYIDRLTQARDLLLPKLMNGEITV